MIPKSFKDSIVFVLILLTGIALYLKSYEFTHLTFSLLLLFVAITRQSINTKIFGFYLFLYYFIPFFNISTYRGTISFYTLQIYTYANFALILPLLFTISKNVFKKNEVKYKKIAITPFFVNVVIIQTIIVYLLVAYVFVTVGNVLVHQELRFFMSPMMSYLIKSTLYIPLFTLFFERSQFTKKNILLFIILPLFPAFFIGSRGTVIMIIISVLVLYLLKNINIGEKYYLKNSKAWRNNKHWVYLTCCIGLILFQIVYYTRRLVSTTFLSPSELAIRYFGNDNWYNMLIMPVYFSLRETVGITEKIIKENVSNTFFDYPMFFSELMTILPGEQPSPGIVLSKRLYQTNYEGGITPGVIGALYIDYRDWLIPILFFTSFIIYFLYKKSLGSDMYKLLYALTITQFFHIYHRGFFKPEYLVAYAIVLFYVYISSLKREEYNTMPT